MKNVFNNEEHKIEPEFYMKFASQGWTTLYKNCLHKKFIWDKFRDKYMFYR